jgi:hypothetical protein
LYIATGRGGGGSSEDDLIAAMEDICDNNKMWVDMWSIELSWRAVMEEQIVKLLEEQCLATSLMHQQLYLMWDGFWDNEEFESMQDWVDLGERVVQRMFREARAEWAAELEMEWRKEKEDD